LQCVSERRHWIQISNSGTKHEIKCPGPNRGGAAPRQRYLEVKLDGSKTETTQTDAAKLRINVLRRADFMTFYSRNDFGHVLSLKVLMALFQSTKLKYPTTLQFFSFNRKTTLKVVQTEFIKPNADLTKPES
jgi:hypothetical protein